MLAEPLGGQVVDSLTIVLFALLCRFAIEERERMDVPPSQGRLERQLCWLLASKAAVGCDHESTFVRVDHQRARRLQELADEGTTQESLFQFGVLPAWPIP